jgi:hypothetical protein
VCHFINSIASLIIAVEVCGAIPRVLELQIAYMGDISTHSTRRACGSAVRTRRREELWYSRGAININTEAIAMCVPPHASCLFHCSAAAYLSSCQSDNLLVLSKDDG